MAPESKSAIPLPPIEFSPAANASESETAVHAKLGMLDWLLFLTVCALAFLLASTPARNSDLWLHLASGRSIAEGKAPWGVDPFSSTTNGIFWVNHSWLSDLLLFEGFNETDAGRALVFGKCILVMLIAAMFFCFRRRGLGMGLSAFAACLSLLAAGPWLILQPFLFSFLGVVVTLWLLERPGLVDESKATTARRMRWLLLPLFAVWANLDGWFVLGPAIVGLYGLGEAIASVTRSRAQRRSEFGTLALLTLAGLAACLCTPYHFRIFTWPTPLGITHAERAWMHDPAGRNLVVSPFGRPLTTAPALSGFGGWAYGALLLTSFASFFLCRRSLHLGRMLTWLAVAGLSIYQARTIPFFAVVAGPILALNLNNWLRLTPATKRAEELPPGNSPFGFRILRTTLFSAILALLVLAWPGWLQLPPYQPRAWSCEPDGSILRLTAHLEKLFADSAGREPRRAVTWSPDLAHYLAFYYPAEKGFVDSRWPLFAAVADDYVRMRRCLLEPDSGASAAELRVLADARQIDRILLYDPDGERMTRAFRNLLQDDQGWELVAVEGSSAVFVRRSANTPPWPSLDPRQQAYLPEPDRQAPMSGPRAPTPPEWWDAFPLRPDTRESERAGRRRRETRNPDRAEAALFMVCHEELQGRYRNDDLLRWRVIQTVGLISVGNRTDVPGFCSESVMRLAFCLMPLGRATSQDSDSVKALGTWQFQNFDSPQRTWQHRGSKSLAIAFLSDYDRGTFEWLFLSVRAARRAIASNPDDAGAYIALAQAYLLLDRQLDALGWLTALPELVALRRTQIVTALEFAATLRPELDEPHLLLAQIYYGEGQLDRALDHLRARLQIAEQEAKKNSSDAKAGERERALQNDVKKLEADVHRAQQIYDANTKGQSDPSRVFARAQLAARHGLSQQALDLLKESDVSVFGKEGAQMELELLLSAGRAFNAFALLDPEQETLLGFQEYHILRARAAAACGNYAAAESALTRLDAGLDRVEIGPGLFMPVRSAIALHAADALLTLPPGHDAVHLTTGAFWRNYYLGVLPVLQLAERLRKRAELHVVRGLLALEPGDVETARREFHAALAIWKDQDAAAAGSGLDFFPRPIAQEMLRRIERTAAPTSNSK